MPASAFADRFVTLMLAVGLFSGCESRAGRPTDAALESDASEDRADAISCPKQDTCTPGDCVVTSPTNALITDWKDVGPDGLFVDEDMYSRTASDWWTRFYGGSWVSPKLPGPCDADQTIPAHALAQDTSQGAWHVTGTVGSDWAGIGLWFGPCKIDMSAYDGISFKISGNAGPAGTLTFSVATSSNSPPDPCRTNVGACTAGCASAQRSITVSAGVTTYKLRWSELTGGSPSKQPNATEITGLSWTFAPDYIGGDSFPVDVIIDDVLLFVE